MDTAGPGGFVEKLNQHLQQTGQPGAGKLRLPTEAEWEYAARGGTQTRFWFGDNLNGADDLCIYDPVADQSMWWCGNTTPVGVQQGTGPVGQKRANPFGLYDVHGNVWEWVSDWYGAYPTSAQTDPTGPPAGSSRVMRGGGLYHTAQWSRSAIRGVVPVDGATLKTSSWGFRLACPLLVNTGNSSLFTIALDQPRRRSVRR